MAEILKSHLSYWQDKNKWVINDLNCGCTALEIDVILIGTHVMLRHSYRPFKSMCFGHIEEYLSEMIKHLTKPVYLQIDFKDFNPKIISYVYKEIKAKHNSMPFSVTYVPSSTNVLWRVKIAKEFYNKYKNELPMIWYDDWIKNNHVHSIDLFNKKNTKWWWF